MPTETPIWTVDAFTNEPFRGNPAAVCVTDTPIDTARCQRIAAEMNLSETAFVVPHAERFALRWFTPTREVPICGHATLASAHVLFETGHLAPDATAIFDTQSGALTAQRRDGWIALDFPRFDATPEEAPASLLDRLGVAPVACVRLPDDAIGEPMWILELASEDSVRAAAPDFAGPWPGSVAITAPAKASGIDFVSRFFAPTAGIDEDPVTGAAHCALAPYWARRLDRREFVALQASPRTGVVRITLGDERVSLRGQAVTTLRGTLAC